MTAEPMQSRNDEAATLLAPPPPTTVSMPGTMAPYAKTYLIVGVVAATVSAATAAYVFWSRSRHLSPHAETVQDLLDRCHDQVRDIERRLGELHATSATASSLREPANRPLS